MPATKSKIVIRTILLAGTLISLYFVPWILIWAWILPLPDNVQEQLNEGIEHGFDGSIVYIQQGDQPAELYAAGWHDRDRIIRAYPEAYFKIASIGKLYDAVAITKLVADDLISLDESILNYFPEFAGRIEYAENISVQMLVQHRSGMPNFTDVPDFWMNPPENTEQTLKLFLDKPASFAPGTDYAYSNSNYFLLGLLMEKVTNNSNTQVIQDRILEPLNLKNTFFSLDDIDQDKLMSGYYVGVEEDIKSTNYHSMIATAQDVGIFVKALNTGKLLTKEENEIYSSIYVYDHTGLIPGYQSIAKYHANIDTVVIQFVNTANFDGYTWSISEIVYDRIIKILEKRD
ncbi:beta-lactamase [Gramella sp. Hel_I_59]|uniref:serine hydrolase domain-containing protein n=1 Tax=Gramella sp. Hel_I_59 TaxID=1249978 RepID=UPI00115004A4|nr:serine hydrolase domain-containing protein [Gramella sp. Hel_I_59]TQI71298.1 beta-lactamase [Gramella sp. Hel_I_59]